MKESIKENVKPLIFIVIVLFLTAISAYPQLKFNGRVVEVVDGKTCVVVLPSGKLTVVLQYIEVPDPEQPMHAAVKEHLEQLVLDKMVEFMPRGVMKDRTTGRLYIKGVDVSQQMLRDGAAWYSIAERSSQDEDESLVYQNNEKEARSEKRGVWSVLDLKPVWEYRAEKEARQRQLEKDQLTSAAFVTEMQNLNKTPAKRQPVKALSAESGLWSEREEGTLPKGMVNVGGLLVPQNPSDKLGFVTTPPLSFEVIGDDSAPEMVIGVFYLYGDDGARGMKRFYSVEVESQSEDYNFLTDNSLVVTADKQKINVGKARRTARKYDYGVREILSYEINRQILTKIAGAKNIQVKVGKYNGKIPEGIQDLLKNMLKMTQ